ncbi:Hypothetical predicted protein [Pelobates cultripes]|uniref:Uncharacterized protein n=1 Tax=Pelobates cultripes TaxID=61616 RepID=A0AAD1SZ89_PELCU|nr:Hypothetical predicted protein [Pelobates cultripes]
MFVILGSLVGVCCCKCLKPNIETQGTGPTSTQSRLLSTDQSRDLSRNSGSSSSLAPRASLAIRPQNISSLGAENHNMYINMPTTFSTMGFAQGAQFMCPPTAGTPFMNYGVPPEHSIMLTPATYIDVRSCYGQSLNPYGHNLNTYPPVTQQTEYIMANESPTKC